MSDEIAPVKRRRNRLYVPLDVEFASDPKILEAGPLAAYLYVCSLAYCKRSDRAGEIHAAQLRVLALGLPGKPEKFAETLVKVGLWTETADGWEIPAWLKHNLSPEQLEESKARAKTKSELGNHRRHHEQKGVKVSDCPLCYPDDPSPQGNSTLPTGNVNSPKRREEKRREEKGREVEGREGKRREDKASAGEHSDNSHRGTQRPAAAALEMLIEYRMANDTGITNADGYRTWLTSELREKHRGAIARYIERRPDASAEEIAVYVLDVPGMTARQTEAKRDWYADPHCMSCDGDGIANSAPEGAPATYGPCDCRRPEPYPMADVIELHPERTA